MINRSQWKWIGMVGHLCVGDRCLHHLHTHIGKYCISTVGSYYPRGTEFPMSAVTRDATHETMVFELIDGECPFGIGTIESDSCGEIGEDEYENDRLADKMHMRMCKKYAKMETVSSEPKFAPTPWKARGENDE